MGRKILVYVGTTLAAALPVKVATAEPMGTAFTYQGQLKQGGLPVNNSCDFEVGLWTAEDGGTELGMQVVQAEVKNGLFTLKLNEARQFGANAFNGDARWLEIAVCCPDPSGTTCTGTDFSTLPRQELTPAPHAVRAVTGVGGPDALNVTPDGNVGIGTAEPVDKLDVEGSAVFKGPHPWVDVRAFGAKGDGQKADAKANRDAIQAAIDSLQGTCLNNICNTTAGTCGVDADCPGGHGTVFFPSGTYWVLSSADRPAITVTSSAVVLRGAGLGSQLLNCGEWDGETCSGGGDLLQIGDGITQADNVVVDSLKFHGRDETGWSINARFAPNIRIMRCGFSNSSTSAGAVSLDFSWSSTVTNCLFGSIKNIGIKASQSSNALWIAGNRINGIAGVNIGTGLFLAVTNAHVVGNTIESLEVGIQLDGGSGYFISSYFENNRTSIKNRRDIGLVPPVNGLVIEGGIFSSGTRESDGMIVGLESEAAIDLSNAIGVVIRGNHFMFGTHTSGAPIRITGGGVGPLAIGPNRFEDPNEVVSVGGSQNRTAFIQTYDLQPSGETLLRIGIGTINPTEKLDVVGNVKVSGTIQAGGVIINNGDKINRHVSRVAIWDPGSLAHGASESHSIAVAGAIPGDPVAIGFTSITSGGWQISGQVMANGEVVATLTNNTGNVVDLPSGKLRADVWQHLCGNGTADAGESCDDGNTVSGDGCSSNCQCESTCGDGIPEPPCESCDDGGESVTCDADCTAVECGDRTINVTAGESCDDGNDVDHGNGCDENCHRNDECGDGTVQNLFEVCDTLGDVGCENPVRPTCDSCTACVP